MSATNWRGLCEELTEFVARLTKHYYQPAELLVRARAALSQPEPEVVGPTDEKLLATLDKATADFPPCHPEAEALNAVEYPLALELRKARAVLARFGRPATASVGLNTIDPGWDVGRELELALSAPAPAGGEVAELVAKLRRLAPHNPLGTADPTITRAADLLEQRHPAPVPVAEGEVAELVEWLRDRAAGNERFGAPHAGSQLTRAAALLERQAVTEESSATAPVPVAVRELLPGADKRDHEGCCWWFYPETEDTLAVWVLGPGDAEWQISNPPSSTHWLPATALPLPAGEVE